MNLPERVVALHEALAAAQLPHAFGGALALAYWTRDPRGTSDIDINVFVPAAQAARVLAAMPRGVVADRAARAALTRDGQARLWWDETPVDLFLDYAPVHEEAARHTVAVEFAGTSLPVLAARELAIFKAMFDRTRDWADIEAMIAAGSLDERELATAVGALAGPEDERLERIAQAARRARSGPVPGNE